MGEKCPGFCHNFLTRSDKWFANFFSPVLPLEPFPIWIPCSGHTPKAPMLDATRGSRSFLYNLLDQGCYRDSHNVLTRTLNRSLALHEKTRVQWSKVFIEVQILKHYHDSLLQDFLELSKCKQASESLLRKGSTRRQLPPPPHSMVVPFCSLEIVWRDECLWHILLGMPFY